MKQFKWCLLLVIGMLLIGMVAPLAAQDDSAEEAQRQAILDMAAGLSAGDMSVLDTLTAEGYVVHSPLGDFDRAGVAGLFTALSNALTDFSVTVDPVLVDGNYASSRTVISGTFENDFVGETGTLPPTGQPFRLEVLNLFMFDENGQVVEEWANYDPALFMAQLGMAGGASADSAASGVVNPDMAAAFAERFDAIFDNGGQMDIAAEIFAPEFVSHLPLAPEVDLAGWQGYVSSFYSAFPDMTQEVNQIIVSEDRVVLHVTYSGTHQGDFFGIAPTGNPVVLDGTGIFTFNEAGLAVENWATINVIDLLAQIGGFPPPAQE